VVAEDKRLRDWYKGTRDQIADVKRSHMDRKRLRGILNEFPLKFDGLKELAEELRRTLFPILEESTLYRNLSWSLEVVQTYDRCVQQSSSQTYGR
jgi:hypothetical protein